MPRSYPSVVRFCDRSSIVRPRPQLAVRAARVFRHPDRRGASYKCMPSRERAAGRKSRVHAWRIIQLPAQTKFVPGDLRRAITSPRRDARPLNSSGKGSATEIRLLLCHRPARYVSMTAGRFACRTIGWPLHNGNKMLMSFSAFVSRRFSRGLVSNYHRQRSFLNNGLFNNLSKNHVNKPSSKPRLN